MFLGILLTALNGNTVSAKSETDAVHEISLHSSFSISQDPLTTEKVWVLDPQAVNPHRQRWVLDRSVRCTGLRAIPHGKSFGVSACELMATNKLYLRPAGPWYRPYSDFSCRRQPESDQFATLEGSEHVGKAASDAWDASLDAGRIRLGVLLSKVRVDDPALVVEKAHQVFDQWLKELDSEWRLRGYVRARAEEWQYYLKTAKAAGLCKKIQKVQIPSWEKMMEPVKGPIPEKLLSRAPARRWDGLYSVRVSVDVGGVVLNGRFLVDATAPKSILSPVWMESQGVNPALVQAPYLPPERVKWLGGTGLARHVRVVSATISGLSLPIQEFLLFDTELFTPPEHVSTCCDGVLGMDFLKLYAVQFIPGTSPEMVIWPREGFRWGEDSAWSELYLTGKGELACKRIESPVQPGIDLLGRGPVTFDLPHGRLWFSKQVLDAPKRTNETGVELVYQYGKGEQENERELRVKKIRKTSASKPLLQAGLKPGMQIVEIDSKQAEDVDQWEVSQRLSGVYGDQVTLKWKTRGGFKVAPLKVR